MQTITIEQEMILLAARHKIGLYSIKEICAMFGCNRYSIDNALNSNKLNFVSPNHRDRYIYISDFLEYMNSKNDVRKTNVQDEHLV